MSKIEVDTIEPQSGTSLTVGASGDTVTVPSGTTLTGASGSTVNIASGSTLTVNSGATIDDTVRSRMTLVSNTTVSKTAAVSSIDLTGIFTSSYSTYQIVINDLSTDGTSTSNNNLTMKLYNTSDALITSSINYVGRLHTQGGSPSDYGGNGQTSVALGVNIYGNTDTPLCGVITFFNPLKTEGRKNFIGHINFHNNGGTSSRMFTQGILQSNTAVGGIQLLPGGNATEINGSDSSLTSSVRVYGIE